MKDNPTYLQEPVQKSGKKKNKESPANLNLEHMEVKNLKMGKGQHFLPR